MNKIKNTLNKLIKVTCMCVRRSKINDGEFDIP